VRSQLVHREKSFGANFAAVLRKSSVVFAGIFTDGARAMKLARYSRDGAVETQLQ
jgi:hypothetical protein